MAVNHQELFNSVSFECSKLVTNRYSTSFSLGIKAFSVKFRMPIYAVYGFVRYADEIVDTFHDKDRAGLMADFKIETYKAIAQKISLNPVLHAFQDTVNTYKIEEELIEAFLYSMEMDLEKKTYTEESYKTYIYGSAEVVGLMCLRIFCEGDDEMYQQLKPTARSLGAAFQKVNFLRDIQSDYQDRGRVYFPGVNFERFDEQSKLHIEADIQKDFDDALAGIKQLPVGAKLGVYIAYTYYLKLFKKIKLTPAHAVAQERIRISDTFKLLLYGKAFVQHQLNLV